VGRFLRNGASEQSSTSSQALISN